MKRYELTEKKLHCMARVLQSIVFKDGDRLYGCKYCKFGLECAKKVVTEGEHIHLFELMSLLEELTGVDLCRVDNVDVEKRFLKSSFQTLYPEKYKEIVDIPKGCYAEKIKEIEMEEDIE